MEITDDQFKELINEALSTLPKTHMDKLQNVAILLEEDVSEEERVDMGLVAGQTLLGLYRGVPLPQRQGMQTSVPDTITLYKRPILAQVSTMAELKEEIRHTLWHEIAHYFGLDHQRISELE